MSEHVFYSGKERTEFHLARGEEVTTWNSDRAKQYCIGRRATLIENTPDGKWLSETILQNYQQINTRQAENLWKEASRSYARNAKGDVTCFTKNATEDRVFRQVELPELAKNQRVSHINGIPREKLQNGLNKVNGDLEIMKQIAENERGVYMVERPGIAEKRQTLHQGGALHEKATQTAFLHREDNKLKEPKQELSPSKTATKGFSNTELAQAGTARQKHLQQQGAQPHSLAARQKRDAETYFGAKRNPPKPQHDTKNPEMKGGSWGVKNDPPKPPSQKKTTARPKPPEPTRKSTNPQKTSPLQKSSNSAKPTPKNAPQKNTAKPVNNSSATSQKINAGQPTPKQNAVTSKTDSTPKHTPAPKPPQKPVGQTNQIKENVAPKAPSSSTQKVGQSAPKSPSASNSPKPSEPKTSATGSSKAPQANKPATQTPAAPKQSAKTEAPKAAAPKPKPTPPPKPPPPPRPKPPPPPPPPAPPPPKPPPPPPPVAKK